jgi:predicted amidohydrolase
MDLPSASLGIALLIQLVAVQMHLDINDFWTRDAFEAKMHQLMDRVAAGIDPDIPTLVAFPEDVGLLLVAQGMEAHLKEADSIDAALEAAIKAELLSSAKEQSLNELHWVPALLLQRSRIIAETYFEVFSGLAQKYGVYIVAGSLVLPPYALSDGQVQWQAGPLEDRVYNTSYFFGPDGKVIGKQDKVFLIDLEKEGGLHLDAGDLDSLRVFDTPLGRVGIAICFDAFHEEVIDELSRQGAEILVQPSANPGHWSPEQQLDWLRGCYHRTFEEGRFEYAVNPMMTGTLWNMSFFGQSSIVARKPHDLEEAETQRWGYRDLGPAEGFISVAASDCDEEILIATVPHPKARKSG